MSINPICRTVTAPALALLIALILSACGSGPEVSTTPPPDSSPATGLSIGGNISGLGAGKSLLINLNGSNALTLSANGSFTLPNTFISGSSYSVTVGAQPVEQTCMITNGSGTVTSSNVTNLTLSCITNTYTLSGTVTGLGTGKSVVINTNGGNALTLSANGSFTLPNTFISGSSYTVTVGAQPVDQTCMVTNDSGTVTSINVTNLTLSCTNNNIAPTITGTPNTTVLANTLYSFTPIASDANGDTLAYTITNKPTWATFNTATGELRGTPTTANSYANIVISVSDGTASVSLAAFTITVQPSTGNAVLSWTKPTQNTDGSTLTDLTGYVIYYGTSTSTLTSSMTVSGGDTLTATIDGLPTGITYYFAIASVSASGGEGNKSNPASKTI